MSTFKDSNENHDAVLSALAKSLRFGRAALNMTQEALAEKSGVSRATIAQIERLEGDPRLSTILDLAAALETSPILLLMSEREMEKIEILIRNTAAVKELRKAIPEQEFHDIDRLHKIGRDKHAAEIGAGVVTRVGELKSAAIGAAIGTVLLPGFGTVIGAVLGRVLSPISAARLAPGIKSSRKLESSTK